MMLNLLVKRVQRQSNESVAESTVLYCWAFKANCFLDGRQIGGSCGWGCVLKLPWLKSVPLMRLHSAISTASEPDCVMVN